MSRFQRRVLLATMLAWGLGSVAPVRAGDGCYYSGWKSYPERNYSYCYCYYEPPPPPQPPPTPPPPQYHYCIYYPATPKYCYYYNPVKKRYWGRYDLEAQAYSMLDEKDRKENLSDIPESAFPKPGKMPEVPGAKEGIILPAPPAVPK